MTVPFRLWRDAILFDSWRSLATRGLLTLALGLCALSAPGLTLTVLVVLFGVFAVADGLLTVGAATQAGHLGWASGTAGLASLALGLVAFVVPVATASGLVALIAAWALATGALEVGAASHMTHGRLALRVGGGLSVLFGLALILAPLPSLAGLTWILGAFACATGAIDLALGLHLRRQRTLEPPSEEPADDDHESAGPAEATDLGRIPKPGNLGGVRPGRSI